MHDARVPSDKFLYVFKTGPDGAGSARRPKDSPLTPSTPRCCVTGCGAAGRTCQSGAVRDDVELSPCERPRYGVRPLSGAVVHQIGRQPAVTVVSRVGTWASRAARLTFPSHGLLPVKGAMILRDPRRRPPVTLTGRSIMTSLRDLRPLTASLPGREAANARGRPPKNTGATAPHDHQAGPVPDSDPT